MRQTSSRQRPGLVIFEGIMGSGKSTTALRLAERSTAAGVPAHAVTEGARPHPIRFDWDLPWEEMPASRLATASIARWRAYAESLSASPSIAFVDGQLFHGNLTSLFLLDADDALLRAYVADVSAAVRRLCPLVVYFRQNDVGRAVRTIAAERGETWAAHQVDWKLASPYAVRRGLTGFDGLIEVYRSYRRLIDQLYADLDIPKLSIETSGGKWATYEDVVASAIEALAAASG